MIEASFPPPPPDSALSESAIKPDMKISEKSLNLVWWVTYMSTKLRVFCQFKGAIHGLPEFFKCAALQSLVDENDVFFSTKVLLIKLTPPFL